MKVRLNLIFASLAAVSCLGLGFAVATPAHAGGPSKPPCCKPTPPKPPCCQPQPPCCKPTPPPPCCGGGHQINIPNVNVNVGATVIINASAQAFGMANARAGA